MNYNSWLINVFFNFKNYYLEENKEELKDLPSQKKLFIVIKEFKLMDDNYKDNFFKDDNYKNIIQKNHKLLKKSESKESLFDIFLKQNLIKVEKLKNLNVENLRRRIQSLKAN